MNGARTDTVLTAIDAFRVRRWNIGLVGIAAFLHVCAKEGLSVKELAYLCGASEASVSRAVQALRRPSFDSEDIAHGGLLEVCDHPEDRRRIMVFLTKDGHALRDAIVDALAQSAGKVESADA